MSTLKILGAGNDNEKICISSFISNTKHNWQQAVSFYHAHKYIPWNHTARVKKTPRVVNELLVCRRLGSHLGDGTLDEDEHFLVGQPVQWSGKAVQACREREVRVWQRGTNQMTRVCRDVASFVITGTRKQTKNTHATFSWRVGIHCILVDGEWSVNTCKLMQ